MNELQHVEQTKVEYVSVDDVEPVAGALTLAQLRKLRIGRKVLVYSTVTFEYPERGKRRGIVYTLPKPRAGYLVGWARRWEGDGGTEYTSRNPWTGEGAESTSWFLPIRQVVVAQVKFALDGGLVEVPLTQIALATSSK